MEINDSSNEETVAEIGTNTARMISFVLVGKIVSFILAAIALIVIARLLGPTEYGIYVIAVAVAGVAGSVGNFGIGTALNKFISEYRSKKKDDSINIVLSNGMAILLIVGLIFTIITFLLSGVVANYVLHSSAYTYVIQIASLDIITAMMFGALYSALIGIGKGPHVTLAAVVQISIQSGLSILLTVYGLGPVGPVFGLLIGQFVGILLALSLIYGKNTFRPVRPSLKEMRSIMKFSNPIAINNVFSTLASDFSVLFLGILVASSIVGNFGIASKTSYLSNIIVESIALSLIPGFSTMFSSKKTKDTIGRFYNKVLYVSMVIVAPFMFFLLFFSTPISFVAFGSSYSLAPLYIAITAAGMIIVIAGRYASVLLIGANKTMDVLRYRAMIFAVQIASMFFLVYFLKGLGLIILVFMLGPILETLFYLRRIVHLYKIRIDGRKISRVVAANILTFIIIYPLTFLFQQNYIYLIISAVAAAILLYPLLLTVVGGMDMSDSRFINDAAKNVPIIGKVLSWLLAYSRIVSRE